MAGNFLKSATFWAAVSAIFSAVAAISTCSMSRNEVVAQRPYIQLKGAAVGNHNDLPGLHFILNFRNTGGRPAEQIQQELWFIDSFKLTPKLVRSSMSNEMGVTDEFTFLIPIDQVPNISPQFVLARVHYFDPTLGKGFSKSFFFRWEGVQDGKAARLLNYLSVEDTEKITKILENSKEYSKDI